MKFNRSTFHLPSTFSSPLLKATSERTAKIAPMPAGSEPLRRAPPPPQPEMHSKPANADAEAPRGCMPWLSLRPRLWREPTRLTVGLPGLHTRTSGSAMPLPVLRDGGGMAEPVLPNDRPSKVVVQAEAKAAASMDAIHPVVHSETRLPMSPSTADALDNEAGLRHEVAQMFGTSRQAAALADRLAAFVPGDTDGDHHAPALMLATALRSVGIEDPAYALRLLDPAERGQSSRELFRLERLLAASAEGTSALAHLRGWPADAAEQQMRRDALRLCSELEVKGFPIAGHDSVDSVVRSLRARSDTRLG